MPMSGGVLLLYAHKILLKYLFPEKNIHRNMLSKMPEMYM